MIKSKGFLIGLLCFFAVSSQAQWATYRSVKAKAEVISQTEIKLTFDQEERGTFTGFQVYRRNFGSESWSLLQALDSSVTSYNDKSVEAGKVYEYNVRKLHVQDEPFANGKLVGNSYITAGIDIPTKFHQGVVLLLVKKNLVDGIPSDIEDLQAQLNSAGWAVYKEVIDDETVPEVKDIIKSYSELHNLTSVYILGHVPVPYSGLYCNSGYGTPDGHTQNAGAHCGAWAADAYYAVLADKFTDVGTMTDAARAANKNEPGDGKFDQNKLPDNAIISVGRVDFSNMPAFSKTEEELTSQYIKKTNDFRNLSTTVVMKGVIDENFSTLGEGFSTQGWRDFSVIVGPKNVTAGDYFTSQSEGSLLLGYGAGAGSFTSCNGIGKTSDFVSNDKAAYFNFLFGSYFGDYDNQNNFLNAPLATSQGGLTNGWSGRPQWLAHPLGLGYTIGESVLISQNNQSNNNYLALFYMGGMHVALLGDPTLKALQVVPVSNLSIAANGDRTEATLTWNASTDNDVIGYHIYRAGSAYEKYKLLNVNPVSGTTFVDASPRDGENFYYVRTLKKETSASGTFNNLSIGARTKIENMVSKGLSIYNLEQVSYSVYPNPATSQVQVKLTDRRSAELKILNTSGETVYQIRMKENATTVDVSNLPAGVYMINVEGTFQKLVVQ